ncbi:1,2-dihydroxy-3-keto-5-methylthiopentene dioxygenase [Thoreauomyces humboldtii]|nr:1,2-dihydroxy-3-keto-5-methylthiopentene dioxygenase [Thoreauomyces humboldtii]
MLSVDPQPTPVIQAWYHDLTSKPPTAPHNSGTASVSTAYLLTLGVELIHAPARHPNTVDEAMDRLCVAREYEHRDELTLSNQGDTDGWLPRIYEEHCHPDDEIRYILQGEAYMDVRDHHDRWIRFHLVPDVLLVVPAGLYHRFTLTETNHVRLVRLFKNKSGWVSIVRGPGSDDTPCHQAWRSQFLTSASA